MLLTAELVYLYVKLLILTVVSDEVPGNLTDVSVCKLTHLGLEYMGEISKSESSVRCQSWSSNIPHTISNEIEKEYCDIPFCDEPDCFVFTKNDKLYTHYTHFDNKARNFTFGLKIWDSDNFMNSTARLILTMFALPLHGKEIEELGIGIEIYLSNTNSALTYGNKDSPEYEETHHILKSTEYTFLTLSWSSGFITLQKEGEKKPIFLAEIKTKNNLMGFKKDQFYYYTAQGTNILWTFPFCKETECDVHKTTGENFQQFRLLRDSEIGRDVNFFLRAVHSTQMFFSPNPVTPYPNVEITFQNTDGFTRVIVTPYLNAPRKVVKETTLKGLLDFWKWHEFSITFFSNTLSLYFKKTTGNHEIFQLTNEVFRLMRWFSVSSISGEAHWTFFCKPLKKFDPPPPFLPECALNSDEPDYTGTQDVTNTGMSCLPWAAGEFITNDEGKFSSDQDAVEAWNYCRDPNNERKGTFCYTLTRNEGKKIEKTLCKLRKCRSAECKIAGTGNDYIGKVSTTRSNRTCQNWDTISPVHKVDESFKNDTLYAEQSIEGALNYCRNPSRDLSGSWCYTTDPLVTQDVCNIRDCDKPEEWTILVHGRSEGNKVYILPHWKERGIHGGLRIAFKQWNPDLMYGFFFEILPLTGTDRIELGIGLHNNEKVILTYNNVIIKETTFPHLISSGKWTNLWLQIRKGELLLGYEGIPDPLFEWHNEQNNNAFEPMFLSYGCVSAAPVGVFINNDECHTENIKTGYFTKKYPIGMWSKTERVVHNNLTLHLRGTGTFIIAFIKISYEIDNIVLIFDTTKSTIQFGKQSSTQFTTFLETPVEQELFYSLDSWTQYNISFNEQSLNISTSNRTIFSYNSSFPLIFYWFSVATVDGITFSANCEPVDIGPPRDGGWSSWSPWICTVTCGGGEGFRTRTCSNPKPNIFGKLCEGPPTVTGKCNDFECGDISPATLETINHSLQKKSIHYIVNESDTLVLKNDADLLKKIVKESPNAYYEWTLNGLFIKPEKNHIVFRGDDILVENATFKDSGVYVCMVYRVNKKRVVIQVISLAVKTKQPTIVTRETRHITLTCNSIVLGYIYTELSMKWLINGEIYKDHGITMLVATDHEKIDSLNKTHSGDWQCVIEQKDLSLMWVPKYIKVVVKGKPNVYTNLMEDELTGPLFGWLKTEKNVKIALVILVLFIIACVVAVLILYFKFCRLQQRHYNKNRRFE